MTRAISFTQRGNVTGARQNEDAVTFIDEKHIKAGIVVDGASSLSDTRIIDTPEYSTDAQAYSHKMNDLLGQAVLDKNQSLHNILKNSIKEMSTWIDNFGTTPDRAFEFPSASVALFRIVDDRLEGIALGDAPLVIVKNDGQSMVFSVDHDQENFAALDKELQKGLSIKETWQVIQPVIRRVRELMNSKQPGGYWIAAGDPSAADYAEMITLPIKDVKYVAAFSDGFYEAALGSGLFRDNIELMDSLAKGENPARIFQRIQGILADDPYGKIYPRLKAAADDGSVVFVSFAD
ncbi:hypothetical protein FWC31_01675 [Candidatus Saccharibacteria bacterium]|nr:hypothetical protein [Candidatus Saccharibacteria bacterium]